MTIGWWETFNIDLRGLKDGYFLFSGWVVALLRFGQTFTILLNLNELQNFWEIEKIYNHACQSNAAFTMFQL